MVRVIEKTAIILHRRSAVEDRLSKEKRKARWCWRVTDDIDCLLIARALLVFIKVEEKLRDDSTEVTNRDFLRLLFFFWLLVINSSFDLPIRNFFGKYPRRVDP
jgi:hypothetical protein